MAKRIIFVMTNTNFHRWGYRLFSCEEDAIKYALDLVDNKEEDDSDLCLSDFVWQQYCIKE